MLPHRPLIGTGGTWQEAAYDHAPSTQLPCLRQLWAMCPPAMTHFGKAPKVTPFLLAACDELGGAFDQLLHQQVHLMLSGMEEKTTLGWNIVAPQTLRAMQS